jgi:predicted RNA binding protein YcfA (HicA-like mRNA interferase family)
MRQAIIEIYNSVREKFLDYFASYQPAYAGIDFEGLRERRNDSYLDNVVFFGGFKPMKVRDLRRLIQSHGGRLVRSSAHKIYEMPDGRTAAVPHRNDNEDVRPGTLKNILRLLGINRED